MVELSVIVVGVLFLIVAVIAFKIIKGIIKTAITVFALLAIVLALLTVLVVMDANNLKNNLEAGPNLYLLVDEFRVVTGLEVASQDVKLVNQQQLEEYSNIVANDNVKSIEGYYKVFIIDTALITDANIDSDSLQSEYAEERAVVLNAVLDQTFSDPIFLVQQIKNGNVEVHKETAVFKAIKLMPTGIVKSIANKFLSTAKTALVEKIEE